MITRYEFPNPEQAYKEAAVMLNAQLKRAQKKPVLLLCTGGSAITLVNKILEENLPNDLSVSVLDERYSEDPSVNNCALLLETDFGARLQSRKIPFFDTRVKNGETKEHLAGRYDSLLRSWVADHPDGVVIATMGLGDDGHISGVLPFPENPEHFYHTFMNTERWVAAYDAENKNPYRYRVTTTLAFLREHVNSAIILVTGSKKRIALKQALSTSLDVQMIPSRIVHSFQNALIYTDIRI